MLKLSKTILAKNIRKMFFCKHFLINTNYMYYYFMIIFKKTTYIKDIIKCLKFS